MRKTLMKKYNDKELAAMTPEELKVLQKKAFSGVKIPKKAFSFVSKIRS